MNQNKKNILISKLVGFDAIKFGDFTLKSGKKSNIYVDLRKLISFPSIFKYLYEFGLENTDLLNVDLICGVQFGGLPFANYISFKNQIPQIFVRDMAKIYGTMQMIEGIYKENNTVLLIDDVMTTGMSLIEKIYILNEHKLIVKHILVILDREDSGYQSLKELGYEVISLFKLSELKNWISDKVTYFDNTYANKIYSLCLHKKSNIILSCDFDNTNEILKIIQEIGNNIIGVKLHSDIIKDFDNVFIKKLLYLKEQYNFFIIEDRKLADIGNIVVKQLNGNNKIIKWTDLITVHSITGHEMIQTINNNFPQLNLLLISELSTHDNLIDDTYTKKTIDIANKSNVTGLISQNNIYKFINKFDLLTFSPGINLNNKSDSMGQTYKTENNGLLWIVGRGIYNSCNPVEECIKYKEIGWNHFLNY